MIRKKISLFLLLVAFCLTGYFLTNNSMIKAEEPIAGTSNNSIEELTVGDGKLEKNQQIVANDVQVDELTATTSRSIGTEAKTVDIPVPEGQTETVVSTWTQFVTAFNNNSVTYIRFANDIAYGTGGTNGIYTNARRSSLIINGDNHKLSMGGQQLQLTSGTTVAELTVVNIAEVSQSNIGTGYGFVFVNAALGYYHSGWTLNFGNIQSTTSYYNRLACNTSGQINIIGDVTWYTASEMVTTGGFKVEDDATLISYKLTNGYAEDRSFIWFDQNTNNFNSTDAGSKDFVIGKNASANFRMSNNATSYPVVFSFYDNFILEEGATFNGTMPGNAYRADYRASNFIAKGNNKINLTSLSTGYSPVQFDRRNDRYAAVSDATSERQFYVGPGSELYIISATNNSLFSTVPNPAGYANIGNTVNITIDSPKYLDLRNYSTSTTSAGSSILAATSTVKNFSILNSDLNIWRLADDVNSGAPYAFSSVESTVQSGSSSSLTVNSSDAEVTALLPLSKIRRISALNENPTIVFKDVTNAQKSINYETVLGYFPDKNGMSANGVINYEPVYPGEGKATADITDTFIQDYLSIASGAGGKNTLTTENFNKAGENVIGTAYFGKRTQTEPTTYKVWDVVPPDPADITSTDLTEGISVLEGTGEVGATVYLDIDGKRIDAATTTVDEEGNWKVNFDSSLAKIGSVATIYLEDHAGKADITSPPATNNENGNINPKDDLTYQDSTFKAASKVTFVKSNFSITAEDFTMYARDYPKTDEELDALVREKSKAVLTNLDTDEELPASNISVDKTNLPSTSSTTISKGEYKVTLSFKRGETTFSKEITVTIKSTSIMSVKQVYSGTEDAIYSDLETKAQVDNTKTYEEDIDSDLTTILNKMITDKKLTLNYDGYDTVSVEDYKVYQEGEEVIPTPTTVPDDAFTVVFNYTGQLKFKEVAEKIDFGSIAITDTSNTTPLTDASDSQLSIINTEQNKQWKLKASVPEGIKQDVTTNAQSFVGNIMYKDGSGAQYVIGKDAQVIENQKDTDLLSQVDLKNGQTGLFLQQGAGNLKGSYVGKLVWTLEDTPTP